MRSFDDLPIAARGFWAKSSDEGGHGLLAHMLDVAAVAEVLLLRESDSTRRWTANLLGVPCAHVARWCATLVGLHDFGKGIPGFQAKWPTGQVRLEAAGLSFPSRCLSADDHAAASAALLPPYLKRQGLGRQMAQSALQAISAHHGYNFLPGELKRARPLFEPPAWAATRDVIFDAYWATLAPMGVASEQEVGLPWVSWLAGLTSTCDWIGSNVEWFSLQERAPTFEGHYQAALALAEEALDALGWPRYSSLLPTAETTDRLINRMLGSEGLTARPLQEAADALLLKATGPTLLLVEAPMGEGKTELAFLAHLRLQAANAHRGLYVALPTQATGNAMFERTLQFLRAFDPGVTLDIQLAHGGALLNERIAQLRGISGAPGDNVASAVWFSARRRALLSPYGVGTVDQALFATLNTRHHFVRLWGLANRLVVLDEVHAYDTYTSGLIASLLKWLKALGCSVVLMSATLPRARQLELLAAWDVVPATVPNIPYPRVICANHAAVQGATFTTRPQATVEVSGIEESVPALLEQALLAIADGGCGAVIVNTVDRAQQLFTFLSLAVPADCELLLFHSRFPADERRDREARVLSLFGPNGERPTRALLIATQVAEQSLDIDFDFLISDLAPIDLLLQRTGRLHRHTRQRPASHTVPRLTVAGLLSDKFPNLTETAWKFVYDPYILARTWALTAKELRWELPQDIDRLVQQVYDEHRPLPDWVPGDLGEKIEGGDYGAHRAKLQQEALLARHAGLDAADEPQLAYAAKPRGNEEGEGLGIRNQTRLGDDAVTVVPVYVTDAGWQAGPRTSVFDPNAPIGDELAKALFSRQLKLARRSVVHTLLKTEPPLAFGAHPLLKNLRPLLLTDGVSDVCALRLDATLGIVYEKRDKDFLES